MQAIESESCGGTTPTEPCLQNFLGKRSEGLEKSPENAFWNTEKNFPSLTSFEFFLNLHLYKRKLTMYVCMYICIICVYVYMYTFIFP